jgi:hypothetical protein
VGFDCINFEREGVEDKERGFRPRLYALSRSIRIVPRIRLQDIRLGEGLSVATIGFNNPEIPESDPIFLSIHRTHRAIKCSHAGCSGFPNAIIR